jgi:glutathione S-transferase
MLKIWGRKNSSNVRKPLWAAEELGLAYEAIDAGGAFGVVDTPEYRAMNPNGRVPVIEDDGFVLWESNAIVRYLMAKRAGSAWYPADLQARATADKWMDWTTSSFAGPFRTVFWGVLRTPADQQDWSAIKAAIKECEALLAMADQALAPSLTCPAMRSAWATFPWAVSFMPGSKCPSSVRPCRIWRPGTHG